MPFNFGGILLSLVKQVAKSPTFQTAAISAVSGIGKRILDNMNAPEELHKLGQELVEGAPSVVGAIVKNTSAETLVDRTIIPHPENRAVQDIISDRAGGSTGQ